MEFDVLRSARTLGEQTLSFGKSSESKTVVGVTSSAANTQDRGSSTSGLLFPLTRLSSQVSVCVQTPSLVP
jgi:hypothetical protein